MGDRRRAAGAALVEQEDAEVLERARRASPATSAAVGRGASCPGPPWKKTSQGRSRPSGVGDLAREDLDRLPARARVVERELERVVGHEEAGEPVLGELHGAILSGSARGRADAAAAADRSRLRRARGRLGRRAPAVERGGALARGSRNYWICTTRRDGRPHASPVWGLWRDGALVFSCSRASVKARNLARDPRVVVHTESGDDVVILEGEAEEIALDDAIAAEYEAKYGWRVQPDEGSVWLRLAPASAQTWRERDYPRSAARWVFDRRRGRCER